MLKRGLLELVCVAAPKVLGGLGLFALNGVLIRTFDPERFGVYSLCVAGVLLTDAVIGAAVDMGVLRLAPQHRETDRGRSLAIEGAAFWLKTGLMVVLLPLLVLLANPLASAVFQSTKHVDLLYITWLASTAMLVLRSGLVHLQIEKDFRGYGAVDLLHQIVKFGGAAALIGIGAAQPDRILGFFVLGPTMAFIWFAVAHRSSWPVPRLFRPAGIELGRFVGLFLVTFFVGTVVNRLDLYILTAFGDMTAVGIFSAGFVYAMIPDMLASYLAIVIGPRVMPLLEQKRFAGFYRNVQAALFLLAIFGYFAFRAALDLVAPIIFPESFEPSLNVMAILMLGALAGMVSFPLTISLLMFLRPRLLIIMDVASLPVLVAAYVYAIDAAGVDGAAWVTTASRIAKTIFAQVVAWRLAREN